MFYMIIFMSALKLESRHLLRHYIRIKHNVLNNW